MAETLGMTLQRHSSEHAATTEVADLVREIQSGRSSAGFRPLFERFCAPVTHFFANRGFSDQEAEDLAQDALFRVYRNIGTYRSEASFETWLFKIVGNVWKNALRSRQALKRRAEEIPLETVMDGDEADEAATAEPQDPMQGPLEQALAGERTQLFYRFLEQLPPKMRQCVLLRFDQGLKYREIAAVMKISIATVKSQLNAANRRLKPLLEAHSDILS